MVGLPSSEGQGQAKAELQLLLCSLQEDCWVLLTQSCWELRTSPKTDPQTASSGRVSELRLFPCLTPASTEEAHGGGSRFSPFCKAQVFGC